MSICNLAGEDRSHHCTLQASCSSAGPASQDLANHCSNAVWYSVAIVAYHTRAQLCFVSTQLGPGIRLLLQPCLSCDFGIYLLLNFLQDASDLKLY